MNMEVFDFEKCEMPEKKVIEGLCLSYDMLRCNCLETMETCLAAPEGTDVE